MGCLTVLLEYINLFIQVIGHTKRLERYGIWVGWAHTHSCPPLAMPLLLRFLSGSTMNLWKTVALIWNSDKCLSLFDSLTASPCVGTPLALVIVVLWAPVTLATMSLKAMGSALHDDSSMLFSVTSLLLARGLNYEE